MPGTRTAPTVGALTVTKNIISLGLVDVSNDTYSEAVVSEGSELTDMAEIEAWAAAYQPATNASLYRVTQTVVWEGARDPSLAVSAFRAAVESGINLLFRDTTTLEAIDGRLVAPVAAVMNGNTDIPINVAPLPALVTAYLTLLPGTQDFESMQYTGRRERRNNPRIGI